MTVEVTTTVAASPAAVYALVADLSRMGEWSPETTAVTWLGGARGPQEGARFRGSNRNGWHRWRTTCTIVRAEPGTELSWEARTFGLAVALWRYGFSADGSGGTVVAESMDDRRGSLVRALGTVATGVRDRTTHNERTMRATLERLKAVAETPVG